ncbi:MAG TPA: DeoR family transcriptional regulator, partial [Arthrobacter sp.]|nr:DeoR family transcriptional regulator [Arthrobacter sp.]
IAAMAVQLVRPGSAIGLSAGTTTWTFAHRLRELPDLTVVTNSIRIAEVLHRGGQHAPHVVLTGGTRTPSDALVGPIAVSSLRLLHLDQVFLGVHGMDEEAGFTTPNLLEAETDRAFVAAARKTVVLADHTKWGLLGISSIASLEEVDEVISDSGLGMEAQRILQERVGRLRLADLGSVSQAG